MDDAALDDNKSGKTETRKRPADVVDPSSSEASETNQKKAKTTQSLSSNGAHVADKLKVQRSQSSRLDDAAVEAAVAVAVQLTCNSASAEQILQVSTV